MATTTHTAHPPVSARAAPSDPRSRPFSRRAAAVSLGATLTFVVLLAALHAVKPEIDPSWRFISEYAIGPLGWIMQLAFFAFALGFLALAVALRPRLRTLGGTVGLGLAIVSAAGLILAGVFTTDPITASADAMTTSGALHNLGGTLGMAMPFAIGLVTFRLCKDAGPGAARRALLIAAAVSIAGFLAAFVSLGVMLSQSGGAFGPSVPVGWPNRLEMLGYAAWLIVAARHALAPAR